MPRKTIDPGWDQNAGAHRFNEAAARCRGKHLDDAGDEQDVWGLQ